MKISKLSGARSLGLSAALAAVPFLIAQPAFAGHWSLTGAPTGGFTYSPAGSGGGGSLSPTYTASSMSVDFGAGGGSGSLTGNIYYTGTIFWVPNNGDLAHDPAPASVVITETGYAAAGAQYGNAQTTSADDGLGDGSTTTHYTGRGTATQTVSGSKTASHVYSVAIAPGGHYTVTRHVTNFASNSGGSYSGELAYSISAQ